MKPQFFLTGLAVWALGAAHLSAADVPRSPAWPLFEQAAKVSDELRKDPKFGKAEDEQGGKLMAHMAALSFAEQPLHGVPYARSLENPFYASLALAAIAAQGAKTMPEEAQLWALGAQEHALSAQRGPAALHLTFEITPLFEPARAKTLLAASLINNRYGFDDAAALVLAKQTIALNPGGVPQLMEELTADRWKADRAQDAVALLASARGVADKPWAAAQVDAFYKAGKGWFAADKATQTLVLEDALRDLPAAWKKIDAMPAEAREMARYWVTEQLWQTGKKAEAWESLKLMETRITGGGPDVQWIAGVVPRARERWELDEKRAPAKGPRVTDGAAIDAFMAKAEMYPFLEIAGGHVIFASRKQAQDFLAAELPLARRFGIDGMDMMMDPRAYMMGFMARVAAVAGDQSKALAICQEITSPDARMFYLLSCYQISHPLPDAVRSWPIFLVPVADIEIAAAK